MSQRPQATVAIVLMTIAGLVLAQSAPSFEGQVQGWQDGEAEIVLLAPGHVPPPFVRPAEAPTIGQIAEDGRFSLTLPESLPEDAFVPVDDFLDPGCVDAVLDPPDATYFPVAYGIYRDDGSLIGEIFRASSGADVGPQPGEYSTLPGYAEQSFTLSGVCPNPTRRVEEDYDFSVEAGWHEIVQSFEEHPSEPGWRIDRWRNEPVPDDAIWVILRPPG